MTQFVEVERNLQAYLLKANDVIFNNTNSEELVGKTALWTKDQKAVLSNHMTIVRVLKEDLLSPQFVAFYLLKKWMDGYFHQVCRRHVNQASVSIERLKDTPFPDFEISEQHRIAHVLITVQTAIEQQARLIALTRELKSVLMRKLFTEGLRGEKQKETEIGLVPESWDVLQLDELLTRTQYGLSVRGEDSGSYGILRMTNQAEGKISTDKMQFVNITQKDFDNYRLQRGDILFNRTNSLELVGRTAIFDNDGDYVFASYLIRLNTDEKRLNPFFLNHFLNWDESQKRLKSIALRAVSQSNISATRLRTFHVPVPPLEEQTEIIASIDIVTEKMNFHRRRKELLEELFRALLHQLMTGQTRVNDIDLTGLVDL